MAIRELRSRYKHYLSDSVNAFRPQVLVHRIAVHSNPHHTPHECFNDLRWISFNPDFMSKENNIVLRRAIKIWAQGQYLKGTHEIFVVIHKYYL